MVLSIPKKERQRKRGREENGVIFKVFVLYILGVLVVQLKFELRGPGGIGGLAVGFVPSTHMVARSSV